MTFTLGPRSRKNLQGIHPALVRVVERAIQISPQDFTVTDGVRTKAQQRRLYAQGRTAPGPIVTWTLNSNHLPKADGYGHAVDIYPWVDGKVDLKRSGRNDVIAKAMFAAAKSLGVHIRWGADWDEDGRAGERGETDAPHFELRG